MAIDPSGVEGLNSVEPHKFALPASLLRCVTSHGGLDSSIVLIVQKVLTLPGIQLQKWKLYCPPAVCFRLCVLQTVRDNMEHTKSLSKITMSPSSGLLFNVRLLVRDILSSGAHTSERWSLI